MELSNNGWERMWRALSSKRKRQNAYGVIEMVEGKDFVDRNYPGSSVWTEQRISNPPVTGSSPVRGAIES